VYVTSPWRAIPFKRGQKEGVSIVDRALQQVSKVWVDCWSQPYKEEKMRMSKVKKKRKWAWARFVATGTPGFAWQCSRWAPIVVNDNCRHKMTVMADKCVRVCFALVLISCYVDSPLFHVMFALGCIFSFVGSNSQTQTGPKRRKIGGNRGMFK